MNGARFSRRSTQIAVLLRLVAFLVAALSIVVIPSVLAAAAAGHATSRWAFATTGVCGVLTLLTTVAARRVNPLRA